MGLQYMLIGIKALGNACSVRETVRNVKELKLTCSTDNLTNSMTENETFLLYLVRFVEQLLRIGLLNQKKSDLFQF